MFEKPRHVKVRFIEDSPCFIDIDFKVIGNPRTGIKKGDIITMTYAYALILNDLKIIEQTFLEYVD